MKKHEHIGIVEIKSLFKKNQSVQCERLFLMDIDKTSQKVFATYGPFYSMSKVREFAAFHNITIDTEIEEKS